MSILVFPCRASYITDVLWWGLSLFVLSVGVALPWPVRAQSSCEEGREVIGLSVTPFANQELAVSAVEPLSFASRLGIQVGDVIEQANNQLTDGCRSYQQAVKEAREEKKALLLLVHSQGKKRAVVFEKAVWDEPEKKAQQAIASLRTLLETPLPSPMQGQVKLLGDELLRTLRDLESAVSASNILRMPASLSRYEQKLHQTEEQMAALQRLVQGEAEKRVMAGAQVILDYYRTAQEIWQYKAKRLAQTRLDLRKGEQAVHNSPLPYFFDSPVLVWVDRYPFLKTSIATAPHQERFGEQPGEWKPDEAILLLWQAAREETDKLNSWVHGTARNAR